MWSKSYTIVTKEITKEQIWKLFKDVDNWHTWDPGVETAKLEDKFEKGSYFILRPKGGPKVRIRIVEAIENYRFTDMTSFPLAKMYGDHIFEETPEGLKLTITMTVKGLLSRLWVKLVAAKIVAGVPGDVQHQIKAAARL